MSVHHGQLKCFCLVDAALYEYTVRRGCLEYPVSNGLVSQWIRTTCSHEKDIYINKNQTNI